MHGGEEEKGHVTKRRKLHNHPRANDPRIGANTKFKKQHLEVKINFARFSKNREKRARDRFLEEWAKGKDVHGSLQEILQPITAYPTVQKRVSIIANGEESGKGRELITVKIL